MNHEIKCHHPTDPAFQPGEKWVGGSGAKCGIVSVQKYPGAAPDSDHISDYGVTYEYPNGVTYERDAWNFQVRYTHVADLNL